jgi:hypothetical protein
VHVIREDPHNARLLFVGTDVGAYVSTDRGGSWQKFMNGLPTVPVHDLKIHPRDHELIAGTHGRSIWIVDIAPLEQMTADSMRNRTIALYAPKVAYEYGQGTVEGQATGHKIFEGPSPAYGADIWYRLDGGTARGPVKIAITDASGDTIRTLTGPGGPGLHKATWDFRGRAPRAVALSPAGVRDSIVQARRIAVVLDSLDKAGTFPKETIDRLRTATAGGNLQGLAQLFGGGGGSGRAQGGAGAFVPRPGEGPIPRGGAAAVAQGEGASEGAAAVDQGQLGQIAQLFRTPGAAGFGFGLGGGRGGAPVVGTGDYLVTMTVGGERLKQLLHVERLSGGGSAGGFGGGEDDDDDDRDAGLALDP